MDNLEKALNEIGRDLVKELTNQLIKADKSATGNLINSLDYQVVETIDGFFINLLASPYLKYVDEGRRPGKMPPPNKLINWIDQKSIRFTNKRGKLISKESTAFLIARSIGKKGIKPTHVIQKSIDSIYSNKMKLIEQAAIEDIEALIEKILVI